MKISEAHETNITMPQTIPGVLLQQCNRSRFFPSDRRPLSVRKPPPSRVLKTPPPAAARQKTRSIHSNTSVFLLQFAEGHYV
jgi:hypothetical protein